MKLIVLLAVLGLAFYVLFGSEEKSKPAAEPERLKPPVVSAEEPSFSPPPQSPAPPRSPLLHTTVDLAEPIPEAKAQYIAAMRGEVIGVSPNGDTATVDCDYQPPLSEDLFNPAVMQSFTTQYVEKMRIKAQRLANERHFGAIRTVTPDGKMQDATWMPKLKVKGAVLLRGATLAIGDRVYLLVAPIGSQSRVPAYTARFTTVGNVWMWSETGRSGLETGTPGRP